MYVIRLPDGTLRVPHGVLLDGGDDGRVIADAYVEIGPDDPDYDRLLAGSLTERELEDRRRAWREGDAELAAAFEEWKRDQDT
ncbi:hypothetical protein DZF91_37705 [Actinomadura logoneensis]|uniref:Uncharacterized protein n=1 Tax=Actinomadura logoneensis TaxID=2293572 RepID=A0A372J952_9ACTN|nr:hypothetical protein [Actinomadura logoneensis]RFU36520.1 hypothetical protein DZF91_37705 [Actinomadura logoneensis]